MVRSDDDGHVPTVFRPIIHIPMPAELRSSSHGQTMVLTLHNPGHRNALDPAMYAAGVEAVSAAGDNPEIRSLVLVGEGTDFSVGETLRQQSPADRLDALTGLHTWIEEIRMFPKPVIAAVEGSASGAGFALVLACDLAVAARDAVFALPHAASGRTPEGGATWHLAQSLPKALAQELALMGEDVSAERLYALGMVNRLSAPGEALQTALAMADVLNQQAPNVLTGTKELLACATTRTFGQHLAAELAQFATFSVGEGPHGL